MIQAQCTMEEAIAEKIKVMTMPTGGNRRVGSNGNGGFDLIN